MDILASIRKMFVPIHREGYVFILAGVAAMLVLGWLWQPLFWLCGLITSWIIYFFRDPPRVTPIGEGLIVSPADGRVSAVLPAVPPAELGLGPAPRMRVSIFMSIFDCHVNRSPVDGRVLKIAYRPGLFLNADLDKASEDNEQNALLIETPHGPIALVQIAGLIARRIVTAVMEGESPQAGERIGIIRFGSRVDVYLPDGFQVLAGEGQRAIAGESVLASFGHDIRVRGFRTA
ncbi:MAG: phosphatidylserine decarboxylase [Hyphomicrobiales bacterium]|nr:phosphatidylserine decarboxylase [Hyphomicrobiales bacterium]MBV8764589.1 phosphatidylserine decarboxylase [Hyphomicrobiales bacterium]MBV9739512.1 phosphatidylserine decarboxylase [Hyphomicrobiales bacterium]MBW0005975.1 phosphatidylserine decarboxylase [Hyphomicrobiales bacterium]